MGFFPVAILAMCIILSEMRFPYKKLPVVTLTVFVQPFQPLPGIENGKNERNGQMSMAPKAETIAKFARKDGDTGSPEVQIALMTARIVHLTEHLKRNRKDYSTQTGLLALVNRRKKLLAYLARENYDRYVTLCAELGIRRK